MTIHPLRRLGPVALALTMLAALAACIATDATGPPAVAHPAPAAAPPTEAVPVLAPRTTTRPPSARPPTSPGCLGAVVHRLDAAVAGPARQRLCLTVGGVLLVANLGPEGFSADAGDRAECHYAAGTRECRLLRTGTARFTIIVAERTRTVLVRIVPATNPPRPSPACLPAGSTLTIDVDGGPQGWPVCMRTSGVVRVENPGPEGFQVRPAGAVTCSYEAAVRQCRFIRPATVTFTTTHGDAAPRTRTVVAVR